VFLDTPGTPRPGSSTPLPQVERETNGVFTVLYSYYILNGSGTSLRPRLGFSPSPSYVIGPGFSPSPLYVIGPHAFGLDVRYRGDTESSLLTYWDHYVLGHDGDVQGCGVHLYACMCICTILTDQKAGILRAVGIYVRWLLFLLCSVVGNKYVYL
jgi:hypothetical protein